LDAANFGLGVGVKKRKEIRKSRVDGTERRFPMTQLIIALLVAAVVQQPPPTPPSCGINCGLDTPIVLVGG
jgi:hypothetical protein